MNFSVGVKENRHPVYAFTKRFLDENNCLGVFVSDTYGWTLFQNKIMPLYNSDYQLYKNNKKILKENAKISTNKF